jgi:hypothetical protein
MRVSSTCPRTPGVPSSRVRDRRCTVSFPCLGRSRRRSQNRCRFSRSRTTGSPCSQSSHTGPERQTGCARAHHYDRSRYIRYTGWHHGPRRPDRCHTRQLRVASLAPRSFRARRPACDGPHDIGRTLSLRLEVRPKTGRTSPIEWDICPAVARRGGQPPSRSTSARIRAGRRPRPGPERMALTACRGHQPLRDEDICHLTRGVARRRLAMGPR